MTLLQQAPRSVQRYRKSGPHASACAENPGADGGVAKEGSLFHHHGTMVPSPWNDGSITMEQTKGLAQSYIGRGRFCRVEASFRLEQRDHYVRTYKGS